MDLAALEDGPERRRHDVYQVVGLMLPLASSRGGDAAFVIEVLHARNTLESLLPQGAGAGRTAIGTRFGITAVVGHEEDERVVQDTALDVGLARPLGIRGGEGGGSLEESAAAELRALSSCLEAGGPARVSLLPIANMGITKSLISGGDPVMISATAKH